MFATRVRPGYFAKAFHHFNQTRLLSSTGSGGFSQFRSFKSGDQFTKGFYDGAVQVTATVAFQPKDRHKDEGEFVSDYKRMNSAKAAASEAEKSPTGEDNYVLAYSDAGLVVGVLDGVGGWSEQGFDSSAISRELAAKITAHYLEDPSQNSSTLLQQSFADVKREGIVKVGSTTACFGVINGKTRSMDAVNLGDSWFGIFRRDNGHYRCLHESQEQTYYFNAPYQLSIIPKQFLEDAEARGSKYLMNVPSEADDYKEQLQSGDVVVFTTDGMIDNIGPEDIAMYLDDHLTTQDSYKKIGEFNKDLVAHTVQVAKNPQFQSVFAQRLSKMTGQSYIGGKPDDVTAVMVYIQ